MAANPTTFQVVWSDIALGDLENIVEYWAGESLPYAAKLWKTLRHSAESLVHHPFRARLVPELKFIGLDLYRELIVDPYRILFRIKGGTVLVLGVFDGRRDMEEVLFERLTRL